MDVLGLDEVDVKHKVSMNKTVTDEVWYTPEGIFAIDGTPFYVGNLDPKDLNYVIVGNNEGLPIRVKIANIYALKNKTFSGIKTDDNLFNRLGVWEQTNMVKAPSAWISIIPVYGSLKLAEYEAERGGGVGNVSAYSLLAITDICLVKSLVQGGIKLLGVGGAKLIGMEGAVTFGQKASAFLPSWSFRFHYTNMLEPFHVAWSTNLGKFHSVGNYFKQLVKPSTFFSRYFSPKVEYMTSCALPCLMPGLANTGIKAFYCFSSAINAYSRANLHLAPLMLPKLRFSDGSEIEFPKGYKKVPSTHYNPETMQWEKLSIEE